MYKRGGLCQSLIYCLQRPNLPFMDFLNISPLPAGTISVSEAAGETLPEEGVFPLGSGVSCWQALVTSSLPAPPPVLFWVCGRERLHQDTHEPPPLALWRTHFQQVLEG